MNVPEKLDRKYVSIRQEEVMLKKCRSVAMYGEISPRILHKKPECVSLSGVPPYVCVSVSILKSQSVLVFPVSPPSILNS